MTQTIKKEDKERTVPPMKPGQRQQRHHNRRTRQQRRHLLLLLLAFAVLVGMGAGLIFNQQKHDTINKMAPASQSIRQTLTPTSGPATPPPVSGAQMRLADGLRYIDVKTGSGREVTTARHASVEYTVWLQSSGKKLDSTYDRQGQPFAISVGAGQVIKGADEGLVGMREGGSRRLIVPPALGYGTQGYPPVIPPNETLIFDVTVLSVQ